MRSVADARRRPIPACRPPACCSSGPATTKMKRCGEPPVFATSCSVSDGARVISPRLVGWAAGRGWAARPRHRATRGLPRSCPWSASRRTSRRRGDEARLHRRGLGWTVEQHEVRLPSRLGRHGSYSRACHGASAWSDRNRRDGCNARWSGSSASRAFGAARSLNSGLPSRGPRRRLVPASACSAECGRADPRAGAPPGGSCRLPPGGVHTG